MGGDTLRNVWEYSNPVGAVTGSIRKKKEAEQAANAARQSAEAAASKAAADRAYAESEAAVAGRTAGMATAELRPFMLGTTEEQKKKLKRATLFGN